MTKPEMIAAISMPVPVNDRQVKAKTAPSRVGCATTGGTLLTRLCRPFDGVVPVKIGLTSALNQPVPQISRMTQTITQGVMAARISVRRRRARSARRARRHGRGGVVVRAQRGRQPDSRGCQTCRKPIRQAIEISDAPMSTIHGLMKLEIRILRYGEGDPADQDRRPDLEHSAPAGEGPDQPERHDQREERQLAPDHRAEQIGIEPGHRGEAGDRRAERAVGDGRGIGDQRQAGRRQRREAQPDQDRAGHRDRRAEARCTLEERAEGKGDQQQLQPAVGGDAADRLLQGRETPFSTVSR